MSTLRVNRWEFEDNGAVVGTPVQTVFTTSTTQTTYTATIPVDNTIPQSSEGTEVTSLATSITPKKVGNKIKITVNVYWGPSGTANYVFALFKDSDANALKAVSASLSGATYTSVMTFFYVHTVTSLSAITFKLRVGPAVAATFYLNQSSGGALFGGVASSSMIVEEIQA